MKDALIEADGLAESLKELLPMKAEFRQKLDKKFRLEFNYNSNHMEGNTLTYGETELLLIFGDTKGNHNLREYEEIKGHDLAIKLIEDLARDKEHPLTESDIKNLNQIILKEPFWKEAVTSDGQNIRRLIKVGNYKQYPNSVRLQNGEIFQYAEPTETPILMQELIEWYRTEEPALHPITLAAMLHYKFVRIHPFDDGNGRIARLLMNYVLLRYDFPPAIIKSVDKENYLRVLHLADIGDYEPLINYVAERVIWSLKVSIDAAKGKNVAEPDDWEKELQLLKKKIGQKSNAKIESRYSKRKVQTIYENVIEPLAIKWEHQLEKFDSLFYYREFSILITTDVINFGDNKTTSAFLIEELKKLWEYVSSYNDVFIRGIKIFCIYEKLRIPAKETKFWAGTLEVLFHDNAYEMNFQEAIPTKSILYNEFLNNEEIENIISTFSRNLMSLVNGANI